jgi:DNA-binding PadR family transcriptional regulator
MGEGQDPYGRVSGVGVAGGGVSGIGVTLRRHHPTREAGRDMYRSIGYARSMSEHQPDWEGGADHRRGRGHGGPWAEGGRHGGPRAGFGGGGSWGGGRRMRRGDIRTFLLVGLLEGPAHGYELMSRLETRSGGVWRPSPGSVYPTLQLLEEQGLIEGREEGGKRVFELTDAGRVAAEAGRGQQPVEGSESGEHPSLRASVEQLLLAAKQVSVAGDAAQVEAATTIVKEARQRLYRLLAED